MANQQSLSGLSKFGDLKKRLVFLLGALVVFRIGAHIPVPGVDAVALANLFQGARDGIFGMLNMFSGGSLERFTIFAIGIMPYISSSIIVQLASEIIPSLKALKKEGEAGRKIITKYTRYGTVLLAVVQSFAAATFVYQQGVVVTSTLEFYISTVVCLVTGTMFLMWLGEQITERGIGNGISLIITAGIVSGIPSGIARLLELAKSQSFTVVLITFGILLLIYVVVYFESAQRKVPIHYAKRQFGSSMMSGQSIHMPFKLNMAGVIPPIFASSIILFPSTLLGWFGLNDTNSILHRISTLVQHGQPLYIALFATTIIFFCYFPAEKEMKKVEAIIQSMTKEERKKPDILKASRKIRIAKGSGTDVSDVNKLLKQFEQMKSMMKMFSSGKMPNMGAMGKGGKFPF